MISLNKLQSTSLYPEFSQIPFSSTADSDTNSPFQTSPIPSPNRRASVLHPSTMASPLPMPPCSCLKFLPPLLPCYPLPVVHPGWRATTFMKPSMGLPSGRHDPSMASLSIWYFCASFIIQVIYLKYVFSYLLNYILLNNHIHTLFNFLYPKVSRFYI